VECKDFRKIEAVLPQKLSLFSLEDQDKALGSSKRYELLIKFHSIYNVHNSDLKNPLG